MQSILQYRRIGLAVQKQLLRDEEKRAGAIPTIPEEKALEQPLPGQDNQTDAPAQPDDSSSESLEIDCPKEEDNNNDNEESPQVAPTRTRLSERIFLGRALTGVLARHRTVPEGSDPRVFVVGWEGKNDPMNPKNSSTALKVVATVIVSAIAFVVTAASAIDTAILPQASAEFGVSGVVESIATGILSPFLFQTRNTTHSNDCRYLPRGVCCWFCLCGPLFGDLWSQHRLSWRDDHVHDLCHGIWACSKHWGTTGVQIPRWSFWFYAPHMRWRDHL